MADSDIPGSSAPKETQLVYCGVCTWPAEYCEFNSKLSKCKAWLEDKHPSLYDKYYSDDALKNKMGTLSLDKEKKLEADVEKAEKKAERKAAKEEESKKSLKVTIERVERNKRKYVTTIQGLELFGVDLKKAAKMMASKFATGASVTKNPQGMDDITVQGDVSDEVADMLTNPSKKEKDVFGDAGIPDKSIEQIIKKKKEKPLPGTLGTFVA